VIGSKKMSKDQLQTCTLRHANENGTPCSTHGGEFLAIDPEDPGSISGTTRFSEK
jgi:hypothetical protein